mgnify:CR=1 FL=1
MADNILPRTDGLLVKNNIADGLLVKDNIADGLMKKAEFEARSSLMQGAIEAKNLLGKKLSKIEKNKINGNQR